MFTEITQYVQFKNFTANWNELSLLFNRNKDGNFYIFKKSQLAMENITMTQTRHSGLYIRCHYCRHNILISSVTI